jgi:hypothetical protein
MDHDTIETAIQQIVDRSEITDLVHELGRVLDEGRFDDMALLLADEATVRTPGGTASGPQALVAQARRNHRPDMAIQHVITNILVEVDRDESRDADRAEVRANLMVSFAPIAGRTERDLAPAVEYAMGGVYRFGVVRTAGGWRFSRIGTTPIWRAGDQPPVPVRTGTDG